jgi:UDP-glucose 4-epimerase
MKSVLVTGGLGYIGSHVSLLLIQQGYQVTILDNLSNSQESTLEMIRQLALPIKAKLEFVRMDITDKISLDELFKTHTRTNLSEPPFHAIIHLAGLKSVPESINQPELYYRVNVTGSHNLIQLTLQYSVPIFIFSGSATVYGLGKHMTGYSEEQALSPERLTHMYGKSKRLVELEMERSSIDNNNTTQFISLRYFNPVGNHPSGLLGEDIRLERASNLLAMVAKVYCSNNSEAVLNIYGNDYPDTPDGTCQRDFIHVMDLASGHTAALTMSNRSTTSLQIYNLGTGKPVSVMKIITEFENASGRKLPKQIVARRPGDLPICFAKVDQVKQELGWVSQLTITEACCDLLARSRYFLKDVQK